MDQQKSFDYYKYCEVCKQPLPATYHRERCPACEEYILFGKVKEFIRNNDVTEYDVAEEFNLPLRKVKYWISEGRIEYKDEHINSKITGKCQNCGVPIHFGTLCLKCLKQNNTSGYTSFQPSSDHNRMRYLENGDPSK